jgi:hypothetical protein
VTECQPGMVDALGLDQAEAEISEVIIVGSGNGKLDA